MIRLRRYCAYLQLDIMRALKHIAGILLATVGVLFTLGAVVHVFDPDPEIPLWLVGVMFVVLGLVPLTGAFALLRTTLTVTNRCCPQCGGTERQAADLTRRSHNPWVFHFGGWLFGSLWAASREKQVRCVQCDHLYMIETRGTRIAGVLVWIFLLLVLFGVIAQQLKGG